MRRLRRGEGPERVGRLSASQIYQLAVGAGFSGASAVTATAVALAESSGAPDAVGDRNLTTVGEQSTGLWQINYRPGRDAGNPVRDPRVNLDPAANARNAYAISGHGSNFKPWSTYTNGAYRQHLPAALAAAGGASSSSAGSGSGSTGSAGPDLNPFNVSGGGLLGAIFNKTIEGAAHLILPTIFVLGGVVLVVGGVYKAATAGGVAPKAVPVPLPI